MDLVKIQRIVGTCTHKILGTEVPCSAPLMSVGLDSIAATELMNTVSDHMGTFISAITLFDYPSIESIARYVTANKNLTGN